MFEAVFVPLILLTLLVIAWGGPRLRERAREAGLDSQHISDDVEREGFLFSFKRLTLPIGKQTEQWVEYSVELPGALSRLCLADPDVIDLRRNLYPPAEIHARVAPQTPDDEFDGVFDYTDWPESTVEDALQDAQVRRHLLDIRRAYGGLWVEDGVVRVAEPGRPTTMELDVNLEFLSGVLSQLRRRLAELDGSAGEVVLDLDSDARDEPDEAQETADEVVTENA